MSEAHKLYPVGMRVKERFNKLATRRGTVIGHEGKLHVRVLWDNKSYDEPWIYSAIKEEK